MSEETKNTTPVIRISVASALGDKSQISFETYADQVTPVKILNELVDRLMLVRDRQSLKYEIKDKERLLMTERRQVESTKLDYARTKDRISKVRDDHQGRAPFKTSVKDSQDLNNLKTNIETRQTWLTKLEAEIESDKVRFEGM
jgi:hypothetical protein